MNIIMEKRIIKSISIKEMAEILHIHERDYIYIENNFNDVNAYLCKKNLRCIEIRFQYFIVAKAGNII